MVGTMLPIGYGESVRKGWSKTLLCYALGLLVASATFGALLGLVGMALSLQTRMGHWTVPTTVLGAIAVAYGCSDAGLIRLPRPQPKWQVPSSWYRRFKPSTAGLFYGVGLGVGFATRQPAMTFYVLVVGALCLGRPWLSAIAFLLYGFGRLLPLLLIGIERGGDTAGLEQVITRVDAFTPLVRFMNGMALVCVGSFFISGQFQWQV